MPMRIDFAVPPPGCGRSVTDFWGWGAHIAQLCCPDDVSDDMYGRGVPGGALNLISTGYLDRGRYGDPPLQGKIPTAIPGIELGTLWLVFRSSDHQATRLVCSRYIIIIQQVVQCVHIFLRPFINYIISYGLFSNSLFPMSINPQPGGPGDFWSRFSSCSPWWANIKLQGSSARFGSPRVFYFSGTRHIWWAFPHPPPWEAPDWRLATPHGIYIYIYIYIYVCVCVCVCNTVFPILHKFDFTCSSERHPS
jgi:hypothetical protein